MNQKSITPVLVLMVVTITGVLWSVVLHHPLVIGFFPGFLTLVFLAVRREISLKKIIKITAQGIYKTRIVIIILFLVSFLLPSWYLSGTIDQMVKVSLHVISAQHFYLLTFLAAMFFSMLLGTTVGTLSAIGVPILGTAMLLQLAPEAVAGALVSGAFVGDRTSPFSSAHQLLAHTIEVPVKRQWNAMLVTTVSAILLAVIFYGTLDQMKGAPMTNGSTSFSWFLPYF
jgi:Na+:H+ antiporter, NhaC family